MLSTCFDPTVWTKPYRNHPRTAFSQALGAPGRVELLEDDVVEVLDVELELLEDDVLDVPLYRSALTAV